MAKRNSRFVLRYILTPPQKNGGSIWKHILTAPPLSSFLLANSKRCTSDTTNIQQKNLGCSNATTRLNGLKRNLHQSWQYTKQIHTSPIESLPKALGMLWGHLFIYNSARFHQAASNNPNFPFGCILPQRLT